MINFLFTLLVAIIVGYFFQQIKIPGGMMVGGILAVSLLNITTGMAYMPYSSRLVAQIIAGAFIGVGLEKGDLLRLKYIFKPTVTLLTSLLILNVVSGFLIHYTSQIDLVTSLMCAVPGGISDIPIISEDMGADSSKVVILQFLRLVFGICIFPSMINKISRLGYYKQPDEREIHKRNVQCKSNDNFNLLLTIIVASAFGFIGKLSNIPSAVLVFSMFSVIVLNLTTGKAYMPKWMRRFAQVLSGAYIGSSFELHDVLELKNLIVPAIVLLLGYLAACFLIGNVLHKRYKIPINEAMLAATPAGASDMALISADMGIESTDVIVMHIIRVISAVSIFPQVIRFIVHIVN